MNQNQGKASPKISRAGLAKFRPLTSEGKTETQNQSRSNLPNGWYFNENHEKTFWNEIEDSLSVERKEKIEQTNKQTDYQTQMEDSSTRLQSLISQFDDIDQNTLLAMMAIAEEDENGAETTDPNQFLDESKNQIVSFMSEMLDISEAQQSLVENLRSWLTNLLSNDSFLEHEKKEQPDEPNKKQVYDFLGSIVNICSEKTEKAQSLHNDVSDFWKKQVATFKRILYRKDEEISKLKTVAEKAEVLLSKKKVQKQLQKQQRQKEELSAKKQQIENQLTTIEEQKATIEKLRKDLQSSQASAAAAFLANSASEAPRPLADRSQSLSNFKIEAETKFSVYDERIRKLTNEYDRINGLLSEERAKIKNMTKTLEEKESYIKELEANNQKNLRLLALEQEKTVSPTPPPDVPSENDDRLLEIVQMQENLRVLKQQHQEELVRQQETLREKFLVEKQKILDAMSSTENGQIVKEMIDDYENKLTVQKEQPISLVHGALNLTF